MPTNSPLPSRPDGPQRCLLLVGLPGAGKSHLAAGLEAHGVVRLCPDEEMHRRYGVYGVDYPRGTFSAREGPVLEGLKVRLGQLLAEGRPVVLDHGLWTRAERDDWRRAVTAAGGIPVLLVLDTDHDTRWERVRYRNTHGSPADIRFEEHHLHRFRDRYQPPGPDEGPVPYDGDPASALRLLTADADTADATPTTTRWDPAPLPEVVGLFGRAGCRWWIAGGHAIELAVGRELRPHGDVDVLLLRDDQHAVQEVLPGWEWWAADPPGTLRPWLRDERLHPGVHDVWCRPGPGRPWRIQVMLDEGRGGEWVSRRDATVRRPVAGIGAVSPDGIPYLRPEIQLYYKAKQPRPKDERDFDAVLPLLDTGQRAWLADAVSRTLGPHPWTARLR